MAVNNIFLFIFVLCNVLILIKYYSMLIKVKKFDVMEKALFDAINQFMAVQKERDELYVELTDLKLKFSTPLNKIDSKNPGVNVKHTGGLEVVNIKPNEEIKSNNPPIVFYEKRDLTKIQPIEIFCDIPPLKPKKTFKKKAKKK